MLVTNELVVKIRGERLIMSKRLFIVNYYVVNYVVDYTQLKNERCRHHAIPH